MTRDEALEKMRAVKSYMISGNPIWSVTEIGEAFDMAIEALEQPNAAYEVLDAAARYLLCEGVEFCFVSNGKCYVMNINEMKEDGQRK